MGQLRTPKNVPSQLRHDILFKYLPELLESVEGDKKFDKLMTKKACDAARQKNPNFTTCGALPAVVMQRAGIKGPIATGYGVGGVMIEAKKMNVWVDHQDTLHNAMYKSAYGADRLPLPGDVYLLGTRAGDILHVGIITNPEGTLWQTADSGQGAKQLQKALYVDRKYDAKDKLLDGEDAFANAAQAVGMSAAQLKAYGIRPPRVLLGWVDIDRLKAAQE